MKSRVEQVSQSLKKVLGELLLQEFPNVLPLSVVDVLVDPSLRHARTWLRTTPETLELVQQKRADLQLEIIRRLKLPQTPKLEFIVDNQYLEHIDTLFEKMHEEK